MNDGNTLCGMELAGSILNFPMRQRSFYPIIIGDNGVVNLFKATWRPAGREGGAVQ